MRNIRSRLEAFDLAEEHLVNNGTGLVEDKRHLREALLPQAWMRAGGWAMLC